MALKEESDLCILRKKWGRGFRYLDEDGRKIEDKKALSRIQNLAIPPIWDEVMICGSGNGKIQATGIDPKGRKQYIYHQDWIKQSQAEKFAELKRFGKLLPAMRSKCHAIIEDKNYSWEYIMALLVLILDETGIRIGNKHYLNQNKTHGLTSLRRKHLSIDKEHLIFNYKGKSNKNREVDIDDEELIQHIKQAAEQPGYHIFRYKDHSGTWHPVDSSDVNEFISENMSGFTSKYFRTWVANRLAIELWPVAIQKKEESKKELKNILIEMVAKELGNTPAICSEYYLHPNVLNLIKNKRLPIIETKNNSDTQEIHNQTEKILLDAI